MSFFSFLYVICLLQINKVGDKRQRRHDSSSNYDVAFLQTFRRFNDKTILFFCITKRSSLIGSSDEVKVYLIANGLVQKKRCFLVKGSSTHKPFCRGSMAPAKLSPEKKLKLLSILPFTTTINIFFCQ